MIMPLKRRGAQSENNCQSIINEVSRVQSLDKLVKEQNAWLEGYDILEAEECSMR